MGKGRNGLIELKKARENVALNSGYRSSQLKQLLNKKEPLQIDGFDI